MRILIILALTIALASAAATSQVDAHKSKDGPDASCDFHPNADKCKPDSNGNCPEGFSHNDKGNCHPSGPCPEGFFRKTDDESGKCFPRKNTMKTLKCDENGNCTAFCSTASVSGAETTFCFTAKECHKFQRENDGTPCKKQVIHD